MEQRIGETAGRINGRYGEASWTPIRYVNRSHSRSALAGLYRSSRAALVTPLRDGMNLVAKEYVAAQDAEDPGVLILSRFAGAAIECRPRCWSIPTIPRLSPSRSTRRCRCRSRSAARRTADALQDAAANDIKFWGERFHRGSDPTRRSRRAHGAKRQAERRAKAGLFQPLPVARRAARAGFDARVRLKALLTSATCENACGKLPSSSPDAGSYSSLSSPTSLRKSEQAVEQLQAHRRDARASRTRRPARSCRRGTRLRPAAGRRRCGGVVAAAPTHRP